MTNHSNSKDDSDAPSSSRTKNGAGGCVNPIALIIVALIGCCATIFAAFLNSDYLWKLCCSPVPTSPAVSSTPTISIINIQSGNETINTKYAPQEVTVSVNVSNATDYYLYLIVDDGDIEWIQNPLGRIVSDEYRTEGNCYLGDSKNPAPAIGKTFTIYAVISSNEFHQEHDNFEGQPFVAKSNSIDLVRRDLPTPTP